MAVTCCAGCGLTYVDPLPTAEELTRFYADRYRVEYKSAITPSTRHVFRAGCVALERLRVVALLAQPPARVLDCGAGGGEFSYLLSSRGYSFTGIEPNDGYREFARKEYEVDVRPGTADDNDMPDGTFDVITMFHVLEHFRDPRAGLAKLARWLRPGGYLYVEVPNALTAVSSPSNLYHRAHLYYFAAQPLVGLAQSAGLKPVLVDGGPSLANLTAVFRKTEDAALQASPASAHGIVVAANRERTLLRYLTAGSTWTALATRLWRRSRERAAVRTGLGARATLDQLFKTQAPRTGRGAFDN